MSSPGSNASHAWSDAVAAAAGACAVVLACVKAATASITHDEAVSYVLYAAGPWSSLAERYTAANHVLFTALAKVSTSILGPGELSVRLPSLLGAAAAVAALWRILRGGRPGWTAPLGMAAVTFNPMTLDYLAMARGYSLALAAFLIALAMAVAGVSRGLTAGRAALIGLVLALAVGFNLSALFPAAGLAIATALLLAATGRRHGWWRSAAVLTAPIGLGILVHLAAMGWRVEANRPAFWYGTTTLARMAISLDQRALFHEAPAPLVPIDEVARADLLSAVTSAVIVPALATFVLVAAVCAVAKLLRRGAAPPAADASLLVVCAATLAVTVGLLAAANATSAVPYPRGRTGLCIATVFTIAVVAAIRTASGSGIRVARAAGIAAAAVLAAFVIRFLGQLELSRFGEAYPEAHARQDFEKIAALDPAVRRAPFRVLAHPPRYAPGADFYRLARRADWMAPVSPVLEPGVRYDCLLSDASTARSQSVRLHFDELSRDEQTGSVILLPKEPR